jgi:hypothetical protein
VANENVSSIMVAIQREPVSGGDILAMAKVGSPIILKDSAVAAGAPGSHL